MALVYSQPVVGLETLTFVFHLKFLSAACFSCRRCWLAACLPTESMPGFLCGASLPSLAFPSQPNPSHPISSHPPLSRKPKLYAAFHVGTQAREDESPGKRRPSEERRNTNIGAAGTAVAATAGAVSTLSEDPSLAYLHAVVAVVIGSFLSCGEGSLASETLAVGVRTHVRSSP